MQSRAASLRGRVAVRGLQHRHRTVDELPHLGIDKLAFRVDEPGVVHLPDDLGEDPDELACIGGVYAEYLRLYMGQANREPQPD